MSDRFVRDLSARQNADGGWGAVAGAASDTECTALVLIALSRAAAPAESVTGAERWLLDRQEADGAWRYRDDGPVARWPTPVALIALNGRGHDAALDRGMTWLLAQSGEQMPWFQRVREFLTGTQTVELDTTLEGWPWAAGTFAWVEPTAWAVMAIRARWPADPPRAARTRLREAESMLLDRACPGGGWNYGNKRVLEVDLEPYPDTTALALLALRGREDPEIEAGFRAIDRLLGEHASGLALALAVLSHRAWGRDSSSLEARLVKKYADSAFLGETRTLALAALATDTAPGWFGESAHA
ncbi:MAG: hypothetical protein ACREL7_03985 [Longimicrobiales bacterium]